jgi:hypothetical protein
VCVLGGGDSRLCEWVSARWYCGHSHCYLAFGMVFMCWPMSPKMCAISCWIWKAWYVWAMPFYGLHSYGKCVVMLFLTIWWVAIVGGSWCSCPNCTLVNLGWIWRKGVVSLLMVEGVASLCFEKRRPISRSNTCHFLGIMISERYHWVYTNYVG